MVLSESMMSTPAVEVLAEYDRTEQKVENGELCSVDGLPHKIVQGQELYGEDADGNRGRWVDFKRCLKCGEEW
jgi:hypothetical protein